MIVIRSCASIYWVGVAKLNYSGSMLSMLKRLGADADRVEPFEGDKFLVRAAKEEGGEPIFFVKRPREIDPLSDLAIASYAPDKIASPGSDYPLASDDALANLSSIAALPSSFDPETGYLAYPFCRDTRTLRTVLQSGDKGDCDLLFEAGASLGIFHSSAGAALDGQCVEPTDIHALWPDLLQPTALEYSRGAGADYPMLIGYLQSFTGYREGVEGFALNDYAPAICHGDFKFDNVLVNSQTRKIRIIDFNELMRYDPNYDLGTACAEIISVWLYGINYDAVDSFEKAIDDAEGQFSECRRMIDLFIEGYMAESNVPVISGPRIAYFAGRSLINIALGSLHLANHLARYHWACLHVGANIVANAEDFGMLFTHDGGDDAQ